MRTFKVGGDYEEVGKNFKRIFKTLDERVRSLNALPSH